MAILDHQAMQGLPDEDQLDREGPADDGCKSSATYRAGLSDIGIAHCAGISTSGLEYR